MTVHTHLRPELTVVIFWTLALAAAEPAVGLAQTDSLSNRMNGKPEFEFLPIFSYDTDVGIGYGGKAFAVGLVGGNESLDLVLFNSSKGERWYRFVVSLPDFERRQGTEYPLAVDLVFDYDKMIASSFFGVGPDSRLSNREYYTKEPLEASATISRGFSVWIVGQLGLRFKSVRDYHFAMDSRLRLLSPALDSTRASALSVFAGARMDTRNSYINATDGEVFQIEGEWAPRSFAGNMSFTRLSWWCHLYRPIVAPIVFAARIGVSGVEGGDLPVQMLIPIGGGSTLRGSPQDRLLGKVGAVINLEFRFPLVWRFGGVVGGDAGQVWDRLSALGVASWEVNFLGGVRFFMDTFVVRLDVGVGGETTGLYLNFGQLF